MADLVVDEWLWSDLAGENTVEQQREAYGFLEAVWNKCDRVVTVRGSRFDQKATDLWRHTDRTRRGIARFYKDRFSYNSDKSVMLEEDQLEDLPEQLAAEIEPADHYIVRAYFTSKARVIITSDSPLKDVLTRHGIACDHRLAFVPAYISEYGKK